MKKKFSWPSYPKTDSDFHELMRAIDAELAARDLKPFQRTLHVGRLLWEAFTWSGNALPTDELANEPGYGERVILAKANRWYRQMYGDRLNGPGALGLFPTLLGHEVWLARVPHFWGTIEFFSDRNISEQGRSLSKRGDPPATCNVLGMVDGLTPSMIATLSDGAIGAYERLYEIAVGAFIWRRSLPRTQLLSIAQADFDSSTADVVAGRLSQARWNAQQSAEKTIKGLLDIAGTVYPTKGVEGHDLDKLANILAERHGARIAPEIYGAAKYSSSIRYEKSTLPQALQANHAVLSLSRALGQSKEVGEITRSFAQ